MKQLRNCITLVILVLLGSCSHEYKDKSIKADIASRAKEEIAFAGVNYTVTKGVVYLTGFCPSEKEKAKVNATVKKIAGVKSVMDSTQIAAVLLDESLWVKQSVDSILKDYPHVSSQLQQQRITLYGSIPQKQLPKLMESLKLLPVQEIQQQLSFY